MGIQDKEIHHVLIIGAGPVGLAAAAQLVDEGIPFKILEAGSEAGSAVRQWQHVRLFTPWNYLISEPGRKLLAETDWSEPSPTRVPLGQELVEDYLLPLASHPSIAPHILYDTKAVRISRFGADKLQQSGREKLPFEVLTAGPGGPGTVRARAVIDASGTYLTPNPAGSNGAPALGEVEASDSIYYGIPDVNDRDRARYAGKRVGVVGSGHSAFNTLLDLQVLEAQTGAKLYWFVRSRSLDRLFGGEDNDGLRARGALGKRMRRLSESGRLNVVTGFSTAGVHQVDGGIVVEDYDGVRSDVLDELIVVTGFRPDLTITRELQLSLDPVVEAPKALAPLIDPNLHSCATVPPHTYATLGHPDWGYFTVGMKSYGRAPTFLMLTGFEQVRSVVKAIVGDFDAADNVELVLPASGVCGGPAEEESEVACG